MNKIIALIFISLSNFSLMAQVETFSNYSFNGDTYNAIVVKVDLENVKKFDIIENKTYLLHPDFLSSLSTDPQFFLINASVSDSNCNPVGYFVKNSQQLKQADLNSGVGNFYLKPNGALLITGDDAVICESSQIVNSPGVRLGVQSGPMLVINDSINLQFNQNSKNENIRCGVGIYKNSKSEKFIVFAISNNPVSFYEFALFFKKKFKCDTALCLESSGCAMYFPGQVSPNGNFNGLICNYLYFKI